MRISDWSSDVCSSDLFDHYPPALCEEFDRTIAEAGHFYEKFLRGVMWPYEMSRRGDSDLIADWFREAGLTVIAHGVSVEDVAGDLYEQTVAPYLELPWLRYVTPAAEMRQAKQIGRANVCTPVTNAKHV